jgi:hypothetical protein
MNILLTENQLRFITESEVLNEALTLNYARIFQRYVRSENSEIKINELFDRLRQSEDYIGQSKRGERLYFNYDNSIKDYNDITKSEAFYTTTFMLAYLGIKLNIEDYVNGVSELPDGRRVKIPKLLDVAWKKYAEEGKKEINDPEIVKEKQKLLNNYLNDKIREKPKPSLIVISKAKYDIAGMSTGRGWTSCMNIDGGSNYAYITCDLEEGSIIAYLIKKEDLNIKNPIARVLVKPFINRYDENDIIFKPEDVIYGTATKSFGKKVNELLDGSQDIKSVYDLNDRLYNDSGKSTLVAKQISDDNKLKRIEYLIKNGDPMDDELFNLASDKLKNLYLRDAITQQYLTDDQFFYATDEQKKTYIEVGYSYNGYSYSFLTDEQKEWFRENRHLFD